MNTFSLKTLEAEQNILSKCISAVVQEKTKTSDSACDHVKVFIWYTKIFFSTLCFSQSPSSALCAFCFHMQAVLGSTSSFFFFFNYTYFLFKYSVLFPTFFSLFTHCIFFHSCVSNIVAEFIPIISLICLQRKGGFSKELSAQDTFLNPGT